jgi:UPF0716 protein FxsA
MQYFFFLAILALPVLDIASLIAVGSRIGLWPTVAAILLAGILGSILVRSQGFATVRQARAALNAGRFPAREAFDGLCVVVGGGLLIFPGFLSDILGLLLLTPPLRTLLLGLIAAVARRSGRFEVYVAGSGPAPAPGGASGPIIEGEYSPVEEAREEADRTSKPATTADDPRRSPWQPRAPVVVRPEDP